MLVWSAGERIVLTQRMDVDDESGAALVEEAARHGVGIGAESVIVLAFRARGSLAVLPGRMTVDLLERRLASDGVDVLDALLVDDGRWWSYRCEEPCCPSEGRELDPVVSEEVVAAFVLQGSAPFSSRAALAASLAPVAEGRVPGTPRPAGLPLEAWRDEAQAGPIAALLGTVELDDAAIARVLGGLADVRVRDTALWHLTRHDDLRRVLGRLAGIVRVAEPGWVAPVATMTAIAAWLTGDGARAAIALDRALEEDPGYGLALLVDGSLRMGLAPGSWRALMRDLPIEVCRHGQAGRGEDPAPGSPS